MKKLSIVFCAIAGLFAAAVTYAAWGAGPEDLMSGNTQSFFWSATADPNGIVGVSMQLPGVTLRSFQDNDRGTIELLGAMPDPSNRKNVYVSVRVSQHAACNNGTSCGNGPFITKLYRYDIETGKIARIYRYIETNPDSAWGGIILAGFVKNKLLFVPAPANDNSPGSCWLEEKLASGKGLFYLDTKKPWNGAKPYSPSASFVAGRKTALEKCEGYREVGFGENFSLKIGETVTVLASHGDAPPWSAIGTMTLRSSGEEIDVQIQKNGEVMNYSLTPNNQCVELPFGGLGLQVHNDESATFFLSLSCP